MVDDLCHKVAVAWITLLHNCNMAHSSQRAAILQLCPLLFGNWGLIFLYRKYYELKAEIGHTSIYPPGCSAVCQADNDGSGSGDPAGHYIVHEDFLGDNVIKLTCQQPAWSKFTKYKM